MLEMSPNVQVFRKTLTPVACDMSVCDYVKLNGALKDFSNYYASHGCCTWQRLIFEPLYLKQKSKNLHFMTEGRSPLSLNFLNLQHMDLKTFSFINCLWFALDQLPCLKLC